MHVLVEVIVKLLIKNFVLFFRPISSQMKMMKNTRNWHVSKRGIPSTFMFLYPGPDNAQTLNLYFIHTYCTKWGIFSLSLKHLRIMVLSNHLLSKLYFLQIVLQEMTRNTTLHDLEDFHLHLFSHKCCYVVLKALWLCWGFLKIVFPQNTFTSWLFHF